MILAQAIDWKVIPAIPMAKAEETATQILTEDR